MSNQTFEVISWSALEPQLAAPPRKRRSSRGQPAEPEPDPDRLTATIIGMLNSKGGQVVVDGLSVEERPLSSSVEPDRRSAWSVTPHVPETPAVAVRKAIDWIFQDPDAGKRMKVTVGHEAADVMTIDLASPQEVLSPVMASRGHTYVRDGADNQRIDLTWNGTRSGLQLAWLTYLEARRREHIAGESRFTWIVYALMGFLLVPFIVSIWGMSVRLPTSTVWVVAVVGWAGFLLGDIALVVYMLAKRSALYERINFPSKIRSDYAQIKKDLEKKSAEEHRTRSRGGSDYEAPNPYWMTHSYDPQRYYSYPKSTRDLMRLFDMDADEWDANMG